MLPSLKTTVPSWKSNSLGADLLLSEGNTQVGADFSKLLSNQRIHDSRRFWLKLTLMASLCWGQLGSPPVQAQLTNIDLAGFNVTTPLGFSMTGAVAIDWSGYSVSAAGDVNKDGYGDVIVGAPTADPSGKTSAGISYVIYGGSSLNNIDLSNLSPSQGFTIIGAAIGINSGYSVSAAEDVNKDGYGDLIVGAYNASPSGKQSAGVSYVIYGGPSLSNIDLASFSLSQGFAIFGPAAYYSSGYSVSAAGDVNKDGYGDVIIGALSGTLSGRSSSGTAYVIYGGGSLSNIDLASLSSSQGFSILGAATGDEVGYSVSDAGDVNKDGYGDVIMGAHYGDPNGRTDAGTSYVIYGGPSLSNIDLASFSLSQGFSILGAAGSQTNSPLGDQSGWSVSSAGDVNKDGYGDVIVGAYNADPIGRNGAGTAYVIYGGPSLSNIDLASFSLSQGFAIFGAKAPSGLGRSVSAAGDVNNDGYADVIAGAWNASPGGRQSAGTSYVVYGGPSLSNIDLASFNATKGFSILGAAGSQTNPPLGDQSGSSVSSAGDMNKDGYADVIVGAHLASPGGKTNAGVSYVVYGGPGGVTTTSTTTTSTSTLTTTVMPTTTTSTFTTQPTTSTATSTTTTTVVPTIATSTSTIQPTTSTTSPTSTTTSLTSTTSSTATSATQSAAGATLSSSTTTIPTITSTSTSTPMTAAQTTTSSIGISMASSATTASEAQLLTNAISSTPSTATVASTATSTETFFSTTAPKISSTTETTNEPSAFYSTAMSTDTTARSLTTSEKTPTMASPSSTSQSTTTSPLMTAPSSIANITSTTPYNATLQSGGRTASNASSWTGVIVGATIGVVAAIGAGYLAYRKWRGHGKVNPQIKAATVAAVNAIDSAREEDLRMHANPVYEENPLQQAAGAYERTQVNPVYEDASQQPLRTYERPYIGTWDRQAYDVAEPEEQMISRVMRAAYDVLDVTVESRRAYEAPHITTWNPQSYDFVDRDYRPPAYETVLAPQQPWNSEGYEASPFGVSDL